MDPILCFFTLPVLRSSRHRLPRARRHYKTGTPASSLHSFDTLARGRGRDNGHVLLRFRASLALAPLGVHAPRVRGVLENEYRVRALHDSG